MAKVSLDFLCFNKVSSDVHQQTVYSIIFFSNYTYVIYLATDLIYVAPNPLIQDGGFKIEPFSRTIFDVKNNWYWLLFQGRI